MLFQLLALLVLLAILIGPGFYVKKVLKDHGEDLPEIPGTGAQLVQHLLQAHRVAGVEVCKIPGGNHYEPNEKRICLSDEIHDGRSLTAVAVAAHEFSHALQHSRDEKIFAARNRLAAAGLFFQKIASGVFMISPLVSLLIKSPAVAVLGILFWGGTVLLALAFSLINLPVEWDASFGKALPILKEGGYVNEKHLPAIRSLLRAAAFTYMAATLKNALNGILWLRGLRR